MCIKRIHIGMRVFCSFLMICTLLAAFTVPIKAAENDKIKVGYIDNYGIFTDSNLAYSGYGYEYLMEIAEYTGWDYEFIPMEWAEGISRLKSGEIDIFGPLQKTAERERMFDYPNREMGFEYGALYIDNNNTSIFYDDIESFDKLRVGTVEHNFYNIRMEEFCEENEITVEYVNTEAALFRQGLQTGTFDAFVAGSLFDIPNTTVVTRLSSEPFYYATTKGNLEVLDGINMALEQIFKRDAYFAAMLDQKYYGDKSINMPAFTREEAEFIKRNPILTVACDPDWAPIEYYDKSTQTYMGIAIDVMDEIGKITGIQFEFLPTYSFAQSKEMVANKQADLLLGYVEQPDKLGVQYTNPIMEIPITLVGYNGASASTALTVAMPNLDSDTTKQIMLEYPQFTYVDYKNPSDVLDAIQHQKEDLAFINAYVFDEIARQETSQNYITISTKIKMPLYIGVSNAIDPIATQVLNKAIHRISPAQISSMVFSNTVNRAYSIPFSRIIKENSYTIISIIVLLSALIIYICIKNHKRLQKVAYFDGLTELSTLVKFRLDALNLLKSAQSSQYILLSLDIDNFNYVNDSFGYQTGDQILIAISRFFEQKLAPDELISRAGADNFVLLLKCSTNLQWKTGRTLLNSVSHHLLRFLPEHYNITFSVGTYTITDTTEDFALMLDKANFARKSIKGDDTNIIAAYTSDMDNEIEWKKDVTVSMDAALINKEFEVFLQPKYLLKDETLIGAEALIRWNHPKKGLLSPFYFIPIFEQNGFIKKLDLYVFEEVCTLIKKWRDARIPITPISVNLSRLHLHNSFLVDKLLGITREYDISPAYIEIELTESIVFHNTDLLIQTMTQLRQAGFRISIDDFGSGYSSLNMLKDLPVDVLKIDKEFLSDSTEVHNGRVIIEAVTQMAKSLQLTTVAEGVETKEQSQMLVDMGCDIAQGFYYAKPMPVSAFEKLTLAQTSHSL